MKKPSPAKFLIGTGLYTGLAPIAPGTAASFVAMLLIYPISLVFGTPGLFLFLVFWAAATVIVTPDFELHYEKDPSLLVSDEWAGQTIPFISIPFSGVLTEDLIILAAGFLLFRIFDIIKPFGIGQLQKMESGYGVLLDDILAGLYALISLKLLIFIV